jgi:hypothetical protein
MRSEKLIILDFRLSACFKCRSVFSFGLFPGVHPKHRTGTPLPSKHPFYVIYRQISVLNFLNKLHNFRFFFTSKCRLFHNATFFWYLCYSHFTYRVCLNLNAKFRCQKVNNRSELGRDSPYHIAVFFNFDFFI